jgi:hypothetical protein
MLLHRTEAEGIYKRERGRGLSKTEALARARQPLLAASRARVMHEAELGYAGAGA